MSYFWVTVIIILAFCLSALTYYIGKFAAETGDRRALNRLLPEEMPFPVEPAAPPPGPGDAGIEQVYDKMIERLDRRLSRLKELLERADREIEFLGDRKARVGPEPAPAPEPAALDYDREPRTRPAPPKTRPAAAGGTKSRYRRICELNDRGMDVVDIARAVGVGVGEVELVLNLRERRREW